MRLGLLNGRMRAVLLAAWFALVSALLLPGILSARAQDYAPVVTVNGDTITRDGFHQRVRFVRWQYLREIEKLHEATGGNFNLTPTTLITRLFDLQNPRVLGEAVLEQMEDERLLWQAGEEMGVVPTLEDAQALEASFFSAWTGVDVAKLDQDTDAQQFIARWYADATSASGLTANDIRSVFETEALRSALYQHLAVSVPAEEPAVHLRRILCAYHPDDPGSESAPSEEQRTAAEECANNVLDRLAFGDTFSAVAAASSNDAESAPKGGDLGWVLESYLSEDYLAAVQAAETGAVVGPVATTYGLHIIQVVERGEQTLTDEQHAVAIQGYFDLWLQTLREQATIERVADWDAGIPDEPGLDALPEAVYADVSAFSGSAEITVAPASD